MESSVEGVLDSDLHEEEPRDLDKGISIQNLLKIYDDVRKLLFTYLYIHVLKAGDPVFCSCVHVLCVHMSCMGGGVVRFPFLIILASTYHIHMYAVSHIYTYTV